MGYLEKARLGQIWQPWYADLMKQARLTGEATHPWLFTLHFFQSALPLAWTFLVWTCLGQTFLV